MLECLSSKCESLSSNPATIKEGRKEGREGRREGGKKEKRKEKKKFKNDEGILQEAETGRIVDRGQPRQKC
jgi:hypothetical protein